MTKNPALHQLNKSNESYMELFLSFFPKQLTPSLDLNK